MIPVLVCTVTFLLASILVGFEQWALKTGFLYVISNVLGLANPLTGASPSHPVGMVVDCYVSVLALTFVALILSVVAEMGPPMCGITGLHFHIFERKKQKDLVVPMDSF